MGALAGRYNLTDAWPGQSECRRFRSLTWGWNHRANLGKSYAQKFRKPRPLKSVAQHYLPETLVFLTT